MLYKKLDDKSVQCTACNHYCQIQPDKTGICGVRQNVNGNLYLVVYGKAGALQIDPIEKKPLYHFMPGTEILSVGTLGCNLHCSFCQNSELSQRIKNDKILKPSFAEASEMARQVQDDNTKRDPSAEFTLSLPNGVGMTQRKEGSDDTVLGQDLSPKQLVEMAIENSLPSIAYTYNEPTIFAEYALDTMKLAKKQGLKNIWVSNGYMSKECLKEIIPYLDAINIDLKSFSEKFYKTICGGHLEPVLNNIKQIFKTGIHLELTTLVIEGYNDNDNEIKLLVDFIRSISPEIPWHISRFHPAFKMMDVPITSLETLKRIQKIGQKAGFKYIYIGNI